MGRRTTYAHREEGGSRKKIDLRTFELRVDTFEDQILEILDCLDLGAEAVRALNFDFKNLHRDLGQTFHRADDYHVGESIMAHMKMVLANINRIIQETQKDMPRERQNMFRLLAFLHDIAKPETYGEGGTFYGHPQRGFHVVNAMLAQILAGSEEMRQHIARIVRHHHALYELLQAAGNKDYLRKFVESGLSESLEDLILFAQADSMTPRALEEALEAAETIRRDLGAYMGQKAVEDAVKARREARIAQFFAPDSREMRRGVLAPYFQGKPPEQLQQALDFRDLSGLNHYLGQVLRNYAAIKAVNAYLNKG